MGLVWTDVGIVHTEMAVVEQNAASKVGVSLLSYVAPMFVLVACMHVGLHW
jgi:hypothetical protein